MRRTPASANCRSICSIRSLNLVYITFDSLFVVYFSLFDIFLLRGGLDDISVSALIWNDFQEIHFLQYFWNGLHFVLVAEKVDKKIKVLECVVSLVEEGLEVCIDTFVYFAMMILLDEGEIRRRERLI